MNALHASGLNFISCYPWSHSTEPRLATPHHQVWPQYNKVLGTTESTSSFSYKNLDVIVKHFFKTRHFRYVMERVIFHHLPHCQVLNADKTLLCPEGIRVGLHCSVLCLFLFAWRLLKIMNYNVFTFVSSGTRKNKGGSGVHGRYCNPLGKANYPAWPLFRELVESSSNYAVAEKNTSCQKWFSWKVAYLRPGSFVNCQRHC